MQDKEPPTTGPEAIEYALRQLDPQQLENDARETLRTGKKSKRAEAVKMLRITEGLKRNNQTPSDFMIHAVPVIPTQYRPFAAQGDTLIPGDENVLYKDTLDIINAYKDEAKMFGAKNAGQARLAMYDSVKSLYGYGEPVKAKTRSKGIEGYLRKVVGRTAKTSFAQRRLFSRTQDNVGRSTITVDPDLGMDEIGLPRDLAYPMYAPYIQRRLKGKGFTDAEALRHTRERTQDAERALVEEMKERPIISSRAPAWHAHSLVAQRPHLVDGSSIVTNPYTAAGQGADYDGDTVNVHVPSTPEAVKEALEQLVPSKKPFSDRTTDKLVPLPKQEQVLGLYAAATAPATPPVKFSSREEALTAIRQGKVKLSDDIEYPGMDQDIGYVRNSQ